MNASIGDYMPTMPGIFCNMKQSVVLDCFLACITRIRKKKNADDT
jgi:hypothetical protein